MRRGRLELRHPRRRGPLLWDREGGLGAGARARRRSWRRCSPRWGPAEPMLDLKGGPPRLAEAALGAARAALGDRPLTISTRRWGLLERLAGAPRRAPGPLGGVAARGGATAGLAAAGPWATAPACDPTGSRPRSPPSWRRPRPSWHVGRAGRAHAARLVDAGATALVIDDLALLARLAGAPIRPGGRRPHRLEPDQHQRDGRAEQGDAERRRLDAEAEREGRRRSPSP